MRRTPEFWAKLDEARRRDNQKMMEADRKRQEAKKQQKEQK